MRKPSKKHLPGITVDPNIPDFSNDPFVLQKVEKARAFIAKHGLPGDKSPKTKSRKKNKREYKIFHFVGFKIAFNRIQYIPLSLIQKIINALPLWQSIDKKKGKGLDRLLRKTGLIIWIT